MQRGALNRDLRRQTARESQSMEGGVFGNIWRCRKTCLTSVRSETTLGCEQLTGRLSKPGWRSYRLIAPNWQDTHRARLDRSDISGAFVATLGPLSLR
jgi:hypothetical protein